MNGPACSRVFDYCEAVMKQPDKIPQVLIRIAVFVGLAGGAVALVFIVLKALGKL